MRKQCIFKTKNAGLFAKLAAFAVVFMMTTAQMKAQTTFVVTCEGTDATTENSLKKALSEVQAGDIIQLGEDIDLKATMNVASGKNFKLDLNGHKLARSSSVLSGTQFTLINIVANGTLEIIDSDGTSNTRYWVPDATTKQWILQASQPTTGTEGVDYFTTTGGVITGGNNSSGGGIYNAGNLTITDGNITGNYASSSSGGIYSKGTLTITGGNITGNYSNSSTGGIYNTSTLTITGGNITGNSAKSYGGGIYNYKNGTLTITDGNITGNYANNTGGGIYNNGKLTITGGNVTGNSAKSYGGGIYYDGGVAGADPYLKMGGNVVVTGNTVNGNANNVCVYKGTITPSTDTPLTTGATIGVTIKDGTGTFATGATADDAQYFTVDNNRCYMEFDSGNLVLKHNPTTLTVTSNADSGEGSLREALTNALDGDMIVFNLPEGQKTITLASVLPTISHAITIEGSGVTLDGGHTASVTGYQILPASGLKTGTLLAINNVTFTNAGATALNATYNYGEIVLTNCKFLNNHTSGNAKSGGIYCKDSFVTVNNGLFVGNTASSKGGAVYVDPNTDGYTTKMVLNNCTLTGNSAATNGNGNAVNAIAGQNKIYTVELNNCIVVDNTGSSTEIYGATGTGCTITCTNVLGTTANWTNVTTQTGTVAYDGTNPLFKNKTTGDYSLAVNSQAIDKGNNSKVPATLTTDIAGNQRINNTVDCGCYEYIAPLPTITPEQSNVFTGNYVVNEVITISNGTTLQINGTLNSTDPTKLIVEDGGQLIVTNEGVKATVQKEAEYWDNRGTAEWCTIASPIAGEITTSDVDNLLTLKYNLYRYDEPTHYWRNAENDTTPWSNIEQGRGYLYSGKTERTLGFKGEVEVGDVEYSLSCSSTDKLIGFNLLGNPYTHNITLSDITLGSGSLSGYYILEDDAWKVRTAEEEITKCTGFLVQVPAATTATFHNNVSPAKTRNNMSNIAISVSNGQYEDRAYAMFGDSYGLEKMRHLNGEAPMLYISDEGTDYAIAMMNEGVESFALSFKAQTEGSYTITMKNNGSFGYLHLIDRLTGADTDMLAGTYTFNGSQSDPADRFVVTLNENANVSTNDGFIYQSGTDFVVSGQGTLQVIDILGRVVMNKQVNNERVSVSSLHAGTYVVRLIGNEVKTQKIIVR